MGLWRTWVGLGGPSPILIVNVDSFAFRWLFWPPFCHQNPPKSSKGRCRDAFKFCIHILFLDRCFKEVEIFCCIILVASARRMSESMQTVKVLQIHGSASKQYLMFFRLRRTWTSFISRPIFSSFFRAPTGTSFGLPFLRYCLVIFEHLWYILEPPIGKTIGRKRWTND